MLMKLDIHQEVQEVANSRTSFGGLLSILAYLAVIGYTCTLIILDLDQPDIVTEVSAVGFLRDPMVLTIKAKGASFIPVFKTGLKNGCEEQLNFSTFTETELKWQVHSAGQPDVCPLKAGVMNTKNHSDTMLVGPVTTEEYTFSACPLPRLLPSGDYTAGGVLISFSKGSEDNPIIFGNYEVPIGAKELGYNKTWECDTSEVTVDNVTGKVTLHAHQLAGLGIESTSLRATREIRAGTTSPWEYKITEDVSRLKKEFEIPSAGDIKAENNALSSAKLTLLPQRKLHTVFPTECDSDTKVCYLFAFQIPRTLEYTTVQYTEQRAGMLALIGAGLGTFGAFKLITTFLNMIAARLSGKKSAPVLPSPSESALVRGRSETGAQEEHV